MTDQRQTSGTRRASRRIVGGAMTVGLAAVVLMGFGASAASARPSPENPPAPTGTITVGSGGAVTVTATGDWAWAIGTAKGDLKPSASSAANPCGTNYAVGWGMVWNDSNDPGYPIQYGSVPAELVGSTLVVNGNTKDENVHYNTTKSSRCGSYSPTGLTGQWGSETHVYASAASVPATICVVNYVLRHTPTGHKNELLVDKNKRNSFHAAVKAGNGLTWPTSSACFLTSGLRTSPTIVTTATNAQVGSAITDSAVLSGTAPTGTVGGTITFNLYGPSTSTTCSAPIYTSPPVTVSGNGTYGPASFTPTQGAGNYHWVATYSGDVANNGATELCGAAGETSTVTAAPVTAATNPPSSTSTSATVTSATINPAATAPATNTVSEPATATPAAISGATTVHTGEPWAGSKPYVIAVVAFGLALMGFGFFERRRAVVSRISNDSAPSND
jgi:hypothetical protein